MVPACTFSCILALILLQVSSISWPQLTASSHHQQSSLSSNNKNHTKVRFLHDRKWTKINAIPLKRRKGEMNFMKEFMFYMTLSLSSSCLKSLLWKKKYLRYWTGLVLLPCPIILYCNFFLISGQGTQTVLFFIRKYLVISAVLPEYPDDENVIIFRSDSIAVHSILNPLWVVIKWTKQGCMVDYRGVTQLNSFVGLQLRSNILFFLLWHQQRILVTIIYLLYLTNITCCLADLMLKLIQFWFIIQFF